MPKKKKYGKFIIDEQLPSLNEYINKCRENPYSANCFKRKTENSISLYIVKAVRLGELKSFGDTPCTISYTWYEAKANRDVDNIQSAQKFISDSLVKNKIITNDSQKYVKQTFHKVVRSDRGKTYVTVELSEYNPIDDIGVL